MQIDDASDKSPEIIADRSESVEEPTVNESQQADWSKPFSDPEDNEMETADWSDFENDSNISDEIEKELQSMDLESKDSSAGLTYETVEISLPQKSSPSGKAMKIVPKKSKPSQAPPFNLSANEKSPKHVTLKQKNMHSPRKTYTKASHDLGSEFDIRSIDIKGSAQKKSEEFDFFADMAPELETTAKLTNLEPVSDGNVITTSKEPSQNRISFGVVETNIEVS